MTAPSDPALESARALANGGRLEEAITAARAAGESPAKHRLIADLSADLDRWPDALAAWDALAAGRPESLSPADALYRALALAGTGQRDASIAAASEAFARDTQEATAAVYLNLLHQLGAEDQAQEAAQRLRTEAGQRAARAVVDRLRAEGKPAVALAHALVHAAPSPENYAALAQAAVDAKDEETTLEAIYQALKPAPPNAETGARLKAVGTYDVARIEAAIGRKLREHGAHTDALPHLELAADVLEALRPQHLSLNATVWMDLGLVNLWLRRNAAAARLFARAAERLDEAGEANDAATARVQRARALALAGQGDEGRALLQTLIQELTGRADLADALAVASTELGRQQFENGDLADAVRSFETALRGPLDPSVEVNVRMLLAQALLREGHGAAALAAALPALEKADSVSEGKRAELEKLVAEARSRTPAASQ